jgi:UMF1 family MFS transporter
MGYVGALGSLICALALMFAFGWTETSHWRPLFVFAGLWFLLMAIPTALFLPERARGDSTVRGMALVTLGFRRLAATVRDAGRYRQLLGFLGVFFLYMTVVNMMVYFAVILATDYGFHSTRLVLFTAQITITTAIGAFLTGKFQDRLGHKRTVMIYVLAWLATCVGMAFVPTQGTSAWPVWVLGNALGLSLGGVGTSSRSVVAAFTPRHKSAEFFGLWGLTAKSAAAVGLPIFGVVKAELGNQVLFVVMSAVCAIALALLLLVNQRAGEEAAKLAEDRAGVAFGVPETALV